MNLARLVHIIDSLKIKTKRIFYTFFTKIKYYIYPNVRFGKKISFIGIPKFRNQPGGKITIGNNCTFLSKAKSNMIGINRPCIITTQTNKAEVIIGNNCGFSGTVIGAFDLIKLGNNVRCGANTLITDSDWHLNDPRSGKPKEIIIEDNVWLGEGSKILKGVTIGKNSVIGAGSIVTKSIPANVIAAGNPCRVIKLLNSITL
jgi:acetyltransferase-like isoleucine patch superfamily enzyme